MAGRQIVVEFLGDARNLKKAMGDVESRSGSLGSKLSKVGKIAAVGLGGGLVAAGKAAFDMTKGAIEDEAAAAKLSNTLQRAAGATKGQVAATEDWISAQGKAYGVTDDELRPALSKLVTATHDVAKAQQLAKLAMDISAGSGKSLESVTQALMKAQNGSVAGLAKFGIKTKDSEKDTMALQSAQIALTSAHEKYSDAVKEFGPHSKEARDASAKLEYAQTKLGQAQQKTKSYTIDFDEATQRLTKTWQGSAKTAAETTAGKMQRLKVMLSETGEAIGYKLIPIATAMADFFLNKFIPAIGKASDWFNKNLMPAIRHIGDVVKSVFGGMDGNVSGPMKDIVSTIKSAVSIIQSLWKRFGGIITDYARGTFKNVFTVVKGAFRVISGLFKVFSSLLKGDWRGVWQGIKQILSGAFEVLKGLVKQFFNVAKLLFRLGWSAIRGIFSGAWDGIKTLVANGIGKVVDVIRGVPGKIKALGGSFRDAGRAVIGAMVDGLKNAGGLVSDIAGNVWNAVRGLLNNAIAKINSALEFKISLPGPDITINPPDIPRLAKGGIVTGPTLALIGEDGPEAVVPLGRKNAPKGRLGVGGDETLIVKLYLDSREVQQVLLKRKRDTGRPLGLA